MCRNCIGYCYIYIFSCGIFIVYCVCKLLPCFNSLAVDAYCSSWFKDILFRSCRRRICNFISVIIVFAVIYLGFVLYNLAIYIFFNSYLKCDCNALSLVNILSPFYDSIRMTSTIFCWYKFCKVRQLICYSCFYIISCCICISYFVCKLISWLYSLTVDVCSCATLKDFFLRLCWRRICHLVSVIIVFAVIYLSFVL